METANEKTPSKEEEVAAKADEISAEAADNGQESGRAIELASLRLSEKNSGPVQEDVAAIDTFFRSQPPGVWKRMLQRMQPDDIIIATPAVEKHLIELLETPPCKIVLLSSLPRSLETVTGRVLLFLFDREMLVRKIIQRLTPRMPVFSVMTDLLPNEIHSPVKLVWPDPPRPIEVDRGVEKPVPVCVIGSAGSEVGFFAEAFCRAGFGEMRPYMPKTIPDAHDVTGSFPIVRYVRALEQRYAEHGAYSGYIYTHVLERCIQNGLFTLSRLAAYLEARKAKVIYYTMRDKIRQAVFATSFERRVTESVWEMAQGQRQQFRARPVNPRRAVNKIASLIEQDIRTEKLINALPNVQVITHEDFVMAPKEVLEAVSRHTGRLGDVTTENNWLGFVDHMMPSLDEDTKQLTRLFIDRLGLHTNAAGSLVTLQQLVSEVVEERMMAEKAELQ